MDWEVDMPGDPIIIIRTAARLGLFF